MDDSGISGDIRIVGGVPFRVTPNRGDTSWAERYCVQAGPPLRHLFDEPQPIEGAWPVCGWLLSDLPSGTWRVRFGPALPHTGQAVAVRTFNDGMLLLADRWQRTREPDASTGPASHRARPRRLGNGARRTAGYESPERAHNTVDSWPSRPSSY